MAALTHKALLATLTTAQRAQLTQRNNIDGSRQLLVHAGLIGLLVMLIAVRAPLWPLLMLPLGVLLVFLFTLLHETTHRTAFSSRRVNDLISMCCGWLLFLPPRWFRYFHFAHHRYTQDPERDPELATAKLDSMPAYLWHVSGLPVTYSLLKTLLINAAGRGAEPFVTSEARAKVIFESRCMLLSYVLLTTAAVVFGFIEFLLLCWWLPLMIGQPFLRLYLMAEHGRCPFVDNMFANTRTVFTHWLICKLAWNMPFHAEHHAYPNVPFHRLPQFHLLVKDRLLETSNGYVEFHRQTIHAHRQQSS
ncbi:MAG: fatty acid desaturase [Pseudomonadota bacterium]